MRDAGGHWLPRPVAPGEGDLVQNLVVLRLRAG
jgi:hypothetical protein